MMSKIPQALGLKPVSVDTRTGLCSRARIPLGKDLASIGGMATRPGLDPLCTQQIEIHCAIVGRLPSPRSTHMHTPRRPYPEGPRKSKHFQCVTPADLPPSAIVGTTRDIIQLPDGNNVNWATVLKLDRVKGFKANWNRRGCQQTLAAISSGDIRSLLNIV
jgi:hypothetical protein